MNNNIDCERLVRGAEEINRKRKVITRVITMVESILNSLSLKTYHWKYQQSVLEIPLGELKFVLVYHKGTLGGEFIDQNGKCQFHWWGTTNRADGIPAYAVPTIYNYLSTIVEKADETFPNAGIRVHFDFFSKQAD